MNAMVMGVTDIVSNWGMVIFIKTNRIFHQIGYRRAASELSRLGYHKEAANCIRLMNTL